MDELEKKGYNLDVTDQLPKAIEYFSTHPLHQTRWRALEKLLEGALVTRDLCKCPPLSDYKKFNQKLIRLVQRPGQSTPHIEIVVVDN